MELSVYDNAGLPDHLAPARRVAADDVVELGGRGAGDADGLAHEGHPFSERGGETRGQNVHRGLLGVGVGVGVGVGLTDVRVKVTPVEAL